MFSETNKFSFSKLTIDICEQIGREGQKEPAEYCVITHFESQFHKSSESTFHLSTHAFNAENLQ